MTIREILRIALESQNVFLPSQDILRPANKMSRPIKHNVLMVVIDDIEMNLFGEITMALIGMPPRQIRHDDPKPPAKQKHSVHRHNAETVAVSDPVVSARAALTKEEFRALLDRAGFTQAGFAAHIDVNVKTVSRWALGLWPVPRVVTLYLETLGRAA